MTESRHRRRFWHLFSSLGGRLRLFVPYFVFVLAWAAVIYAVSWIFHSALNQAIGTADTVTPDDIVRLRQLGERLMQIVTIGLAGSGLLCFAFWMQFSHGVFGPMVQIKRHIQRLNQGDYETEIRLRAGDEFKTIADSLNELARNMKAGKTGT